MTTTRINHTGHDHPSTTAARTACRKAMKAAVPTTFPTAWVGAGKALHLAVIDNDGHIYGVRCGAGLTRRGGDSAYRAGNNLPLADVTCTKCHKLGA